MKCYVIAWSIMLSKNIEHLIICPRTIMEISIKKMTNTITVLSLN